MDRLMEGLMDGWMGGWTCRTLLMIGGDLTSFSAFFLALAFSTCFLVFFGLRAFFRFCFFLRILSNMSDLWKHTTLILCVCMCVCVCWSVFTFADRHAPKRAHMSAHTLTDRIWPSL